MSPRAAEPPNDPNFGRLPEEIKAAELAAELEAANQRIAELERRAAAAALDAPDKFEQLDGELTTAQKIARRLSIGLNEARNRAETAFAQLRASNEAKAIKSAIRALADRDAAGADVAKSIETLARDYARLTALTAKAHDLAAGVELELSGRVGLVLHPGELQSLIAAEMYRLSAAGTEAYTGGQRLAVNAELPGAERPLLLLGNGSAPVTPATTPTLIDRLKEASAFVGDIIQGKRRLDGRSAEAKPVAPIFPGREDRAHIDEAHARGMAGQGTIAMKIAREEHEARQAAFKAGQEPPSRGPTKTAAEIMASDPRPPRREVFDPQGLLSRGEAEAERSEW
jgi:hypothetical protein